jgi:hypothetical protein
MRNNKGYLKIVLDTFGDALEKHEEILSGKLVLIGRLSLTHSCIYDPNQQS